MATPDPEITTRLRLEFLYIRSTLNASPSITNSSSSARNAYVAALFPILNPTCLFENGLYKNKAGPFTLADAVI